MIKAIVMDMDGTLLDSNNQILPKTKQALLELQEKGVRLILASGRSYTRLVPYAKELQMDSHHGYLLEVDGVAVYDIHHDQRKILRRMTIEEVRKVFLELMTLDCESMACFDDGVYDYFPDSIRAIKEKLRKEQGLPKDYPWTAGPWSWLADMRKGYPKITYLKDIDQIQPPINKLQVMQEEEHLESLYLYLVDRFPEFNVFRTAPRQLEILPKGVSKGETLGKIMNENGWSADEVIAFGDGENDVSLFEVVTCSYAMGQARSYVKEKAAHITLSNNEEGIWHALKELDLIEE